MAFLRDHSSVNSSILCDSEDLKLDIQSAQYHILQISIFSDEQVKTSFKMCVCGQKLYVLLNQITHLKK